MSIKVRIRIRHSLRSPLVVMLSVTFFASIALGYFAWNHRAAAAFNSEEESSVATSDMRHYYLTTSVHSGKNADGDDGDGAGVCQPGYHFASLWEIWDTTNLTYNYSSGVTRDDSGGGPPSFTAGWIRTGFDSASSSTPGETNCSNWKSESDKSNGTTAYLPRDWYTGGDLGIWKAEPSTCDRELYVWCVEDYAARDGYDVEGYLPLVIRN